MAKLFAKLRDWLTPAVQKLAGETVTYTRAAGGVLSIPATVGRTAFASNAEGGARVEIGDRDYLIAVADLTQPALGDRITHTIDGANVVFEVQTPDTGEPAWRHSDPARSTWRIHCKRVA